MADKKEDLIKKAVEYGLGTEEFLGKLEAKNLKTMISAFEKKDAELKAAKKSKPVAEKNENVTTVNDLIKKKRIKVAGQSDKEEEKDK